MDYLRVRNWDTFQHYGKRNPPWIKLYNTLLDSIEWTEMPDSAKAHLVGIWLLASRTDNKIPASPEWIRQRIGARSKVDVKLLVRLGFLEPFDDASKTLAHDAGNLLASVETEKIQAPDL